MILKTIWCFSLLSANTSELEAMYDISPERQRFLLENIIPEQFVAENLPPDMWRNARDCTVQEAFFNRFDAVRPSILKEMASDNLVVLYGMVRMPIRDRVVEHAPCSSLVLLSSNATTNDSIGDDVDSIKLSSVDMEIEGNSDIDQDNDDIIISKSSTVYK